MNPNDKIKIDGLIESAMDEYISLHERDEQALQDFNHAELIAEFRRAKECYRSLRFAIDELHREHTLRKRWQYATYLLGAGLVAVAIWGGVRA